VVNGWMMGVLSRRSAVALVNARLASLGHDHDFITVDALDALHARAGHEAHAFGAALGAVLFLAATEHAPRIESRHVELAVPFQAADAPRVARPRRAWPLFAAVAAGAAVGAALVLWLTHRPDFIAPPLPPLPLPQKQSAAVVHPPASVLAGPPKAPPEPVKLPSGPPLRVSLVVPAGDRETARRFTALAAQLRGAGFADVQLQNINAAKNETRPLRHHVVYFFGQDAPLAKNVAGALDSAEDPSHIADPWALILVPEAAGSASQPPGSIDVFGP